MRGSNSTLIDEAHSQEERIDVALENIEEAIRLLKKPRIPNRKMFIEKLEVARKVLLDALDAMPIILS
jgi:hypothetical protein